MSKTNRKPAFWRVKNRDGMYFQNASGNVVHVRDVQFAATWSTLALAKEIAANVGGRAVPVYVTVRKVKRGHDFAWAWRQVSKYARVVESVQGHRYEKLPQLVRAAQVEMLGLWFIARGGS